VLLYHDDDGIVPAYTLWPFGQGASDKFAKSVLGFCKPPFGHETSPPLWLDYLDIIYRSSVEDFNVGRPIYSLFQGKITEDDPASAVRKPYAARSTRNGACSTFSPEGRIIAMT